MSDNDRAEVEAHGMPNVNETVVEDEDVEAHGIQSNVNETVVEEQEQERKLDDLEVPNEQSEAVKGGMSEVGEMESKK